jgi:pimeloyl-ACP methyl ester carboxylesterase
MGGYIAFALYRRAARYIRGLILADTKSEADTDEAREGRRKMQQLVEEQGSHAVADQMLPKLLADPIGGELPRRVRMLIESNDSRAIRNALTALMHRPDSTELIAGIAEPTAIVVGELDSVTPVTAAEAMHRRIARSTLTVITGAGHLSNAERPAAFNDALGRFLADRF